MRLLMFNLATDVTHPVLGFTTTWIRALASRVETIDVLTVRSGPAELPTNVRVHSVGTERGWSRPRRLAAFYRHLLRVVHRNCPDVCFSHMNPLFTVLAAPVLRWRRIPTVTWYAHAHASYTLKLAHHLSAAMVTSLPTAYPYHLDKVTAVGQGIETTLFAPDPTVAPAEPPVVLCVGRFSPVKRLETLVDATALVLRRSVQRFRMSFIGGPTGPRDAEYVRLLGGRIQRLGLADDVSFEGPVRFIDLPARYRGGMVHVNLTPAGFGDKTALESMACGVPTVVANEGFIPTLGEHRDALLFRAGDAADLAARLDGMLRLPQEARVRVGLDLRRQVVDLHGIDRLSAGLIALLRQHASHPQGASSVTQSTVPSWK